MFNFAQGKVQKTSIFNVAENNLIFQRATHND